MTSQEQARDSRPTLDNVLELERLRAQLAEKDATIAALQAENEALARSQGGTGQSPALASPRIVRLRGLSAGPPTLLPSPTTAAANARLLGFKEHLAVVTPRALSLHDCFGIAAPDSVPLAFEGILRAAHNSAGGLAAEANFLALASGFVPLFAETVAHPSAGHTVSALFGERALFSRKLAFVGQCRPELNVRASLIAPDGNPVRRPGFNGKLKSVAKPGSTKVLTTHLST